MRERTVYRDNVPVGSCLTDDQVAAFVEGNLEGAALSALEDHIATCAACAGVIAAVAATIGQPAEEETASTVKAGTRVGRYVILEPIGSGGMGTVYAAHDPSLDRKVALKLVRPDRGGPELEARLLREAKAMARLAHPDVITVFDTGMHGDQLFIAMELVDGGTLREWMRAEKRSWREAFAMFLRAGRGLSQAHASGIVHRDFKPDNVLVGKDGRVRVTDFGLARVVSDEAVAERASPAGANEAENEERVGPDSSVTRTGVLVGTPAYMAPEQLGGATPDVRSDIFSFSVALYEALYGERPFSGKAMRDLLQEKRANQVRSPPEGARVPMRLRRALLVGLRADPSQRYASMDECLVALENATRTKRWPLLASTAVLAAIGVAAFGTMRKDRSPTAPSSPTSATAAPSTTQGACNRACVESHGGAAYTCRSSDGACVPIASEDCTPMFEPSDLSADDTIWLGAMFPLKGPRAEAYGTMSSLGVDLARQEIAKGTSALAGAGASMRVPRLALVSCDDSVDPMRAARHLVDDVGVPAIVGFGSGQTIVDIAGSYLVKRNVLTVASLTSSPLITRLPRPEGLPPMVWRTTFSIDRVADATARMIPALEPKTGKTRVTLVHETNSLGQSFAETLYRQLSFNGKSAVANGADYQELTFPPGSHDSQEVKRLVGSTLRALPTFVILLGGYETTQPVIEQVEAKWPAGAPRPTYLLESDTLELFAPFLGKDADRRRRLFAVLSTSSSTANARFVIRYNATHAQPVAITFNPGSSYDAFFLLAYATFALHGEPVAGPSLARAFSRLVPPGRPIDVGPTGVFDAITALSKGEQIDLQGAAGDLDFDLSNGEAPADFDLLCAEIDASGSATGHDVESGLVYRARTQSVEGALHCP
jgi:serine/threonine protein kinase